MKKTAKMILEKPFPRTVALVGMMGVGKTTMGRRLAPKLGLKFCDADAEIEEASKMTVSHLFAAHGDAAFRDGEAQVIKRLIDGPAHVLATGGGAMLNPKTRALILENCVGLWLKSDLDTLLRRATRRPTRPLLQNGNPRETISRLLQEREPLYAQVPIHVVSRSGPPSRTVDAMVDALLAYADKHPSILKEIGE